MTPRKPTWPNAWALPKPAWRGWNRSAGSRKHAPSIATLRRYADAVDCDLRITLTAKRPLTRKVAKTMEAKAKLAIPRIRKRA